MVVCDRAISGRRTDARAALWLSGHVLPAGGRCPGEPEREPPGSLCARAFLPRARGGARCRDREVSSTRSGSIAPAGTPRPASSTLDVRNGNWTPRLADAATAAHALTASVRSDALFQLSLTPGAAAGRLRPGRALAQRRRPARRQPLSDLSAARRRRHAAAGRGGDRGARPGLDGSRDQQQPARRQSGGLGLGRASSSRDGRKSWPTACGSRMAAPTLTPRSPGSRPDGAPQHFGARPLHLETARHLEEPAHRREYPNEVQITAPDPDTGRAATFHLVPLPPTRSSPAASAASPIGKAPAAWSMSIPRDRLGLSGADRLRRQIIRRSVIATTAVRRPTRSTPHRYAAPAPAP